MLRLPGNLHVEVHKVLRLPRNLRFQVHTVAAPATKSALRGSQSAAAALVAKSARRGSQSALVCIPQRAPTEHRACKIETRVLLACAYLVGLALERNIWTALGHPRDPGIDPFPSAFHPPVADLLRKFGARDVYLDQCQFGGPARRPTQMLVGPAPTFFQHLQQHCAHFVGHRPLIGPCSGGHYRTIPRPYAQLSAALRGTSGVSALQRRPGVAMDTPLGNLPSKVQRFLFFVEHPAGSQPPTISRRTFRFQNRVGTPSSPLVLVGGGAAR